MRRHAIGSVLLMILCVVLFCCAAYAAPHTVVPEGVTEIDLGAILGADAPDLAEAWPLQEDLCVVLHRVGEAEDSLETGEGAHFEILVVDVLHPAILSRTPIPPTALYWHEQVWENGVFCLKFTVEAEPWVSWEDMTDWRQESNYRYIKASVWVDGTVTVSDSSDVWYTIMPGGEQAVFTADDGSLCVVDLNTGREELLLQGIPRVQATPAGDLYFESLDVMPEKPVYIPFWDELPSDTWDEIHDDSYPFEAEDIIFSIREFYAVAPLDAHRIAYHVVSWEWNNGFGVYDLRTRTDHRITGRGNFFGARGNALFGSRLKADADTYETSPLPALVRRQFSEASFWMTNELVAYDISPDGRLLALTGMVPRMIAEAYGEDDEDKESWPDYAHTVAITDMQTGEVVKTYDIENPFAAESKIYFYDNTHLMLYCHPAALGSAYLYFFDLEK